MAFEVEFTDEFEEWWQTLTASEQDAIDHKVGLLAALGPTLGRPHADTVNRSRHANMKELRARTHQSVLRVFFAFDPRQSAILLIGGNKSGRHQQRFYQGMIDQADRLYDQHLQQLTDEGLT